MDNCCAVFGATNPEEPSLVNITGTYEHMAGTTALPEAHITAGAVGGLVFHYLFPGRYLSCSRSAIGYLLNRLSTATGVPLPALVAKAADCAKSEPIDLTEAALESCLAAGTPPPFVAAAILRAGGDLLKRFLAAWEEAVGRSKSIVAIGGGTGAIEALQCKAKILDREIALLKNSESAALGALRLGAVAIKGMSEEVACNLFPNPVRQRVAPLGAPPELKRRTIE
jgi:ribulose kinase